ncbi:aldolase [Lithospermum erythrorhizon]|uniref:Aldolase n=1 Tax=Lithospermum erythrorhizon TaxID=34254 RepID=A0AAV3NU69_LITER
MSEASALCFTPLSPTISLRKKTFSATSSSSYLVRSSPPRPLRFIAKASSSGGSDDLYGKFPWDSSLPDSSLEWVREETVTLFTADGIIQFGGNLVPRRVTGSDRKQGIAKTSQRFRRFKESDYMDPDQSLCLGALFNIAATNGLDSARRLCIFGFCRSIEMLSDVVEDTVLENGGEVVVAEKASQGGLQEKLTMTVAVPLLWGVPPASETLHLAVRSGGGIVDKVYLQWNFL